MCSEYEKHHLEIISEDDSFSSSQAHSEQMTAPINNKKKSNLTTTNHSFSEPDLLKLFSKYGLGKTSLILNSECFRSSKYKKSPKTKSKVEKSRLWPRAKTRLTEMPVILETNPSVSVELE